MIHYELIGAVKEPYISKCEVEFKKERLITLREEIISSCSDIKHYSYKTTSDIIKYDERVINFHSKKIGVREGREYDPDLDEYLVEYDELVYPIEAELIKNILEGDNNSLEMLLDIISNPKRVSKNDDYNNELLKLKEKREEICNLLLKDKIELQYGVLNLNKIDDRIHSLEDYIKRNRNQRPVFDFYQSLRECFTFHNVDMLLLRDFDKTLNFFDYTGDKEVFDSKITRIKRKILKTDK